jgi:uncharacterized protein YceK
MMNRRLVIAVACLAVLLGGCATTLTARDNAPSNEGYASPTSRPRSDFERSTIPDLGPQAP